MIGSAAKAYLFLLRVRAVYGNSKLVTLFVGAGWLVVVCTRVTAAYIVHSSVSPTRLTHFKPRLSTYMQNPLSASGTDWSLHSKKYGTTPRLCPVVEYGI